MTRIDIIVHQYLSRPCNLPLNMLSVLGHNSDNDNVHNGERNVPGQPAIRLGFSLNRRQKMQSCLFFPFLQTALMMTKVQTMQRTSQVSQTKCSDLPAAL